jgi:hypothetical protein
VVVGWSLVSLDSTFPVIVHSPKAGEEEEEE